MVFKCSKDAVCEGIFFRNRYRFNNGIYKFMKDNETLQVEVIEGIVKDFTCVELNMDQDEDV